MDTDWMINICSHRCINGLYINELLLKLGVLIAVCLAKTIISKSLKRKHNRGNNNRLNIKRAGCEAHHLLPVLHL